MIPLYVVQTLVGQVLTSWNTSLITSEAYAAAHAVPPADPQSQAQASSPVIGQYTRWQAVYECAQSTAALLLEVLGNLAVLPGVLQCTSSSGSSSGHSSGGPAEMEQQLEDEESRRIEAMLGQVLEGAEEVLLQPSVSISTAGGPVTGAGAGVQGGASVWESVLAALLSQLHSCVQHQEQFIQRQLAGIDVPGREGVVRRRCAVMHSGTYTELVCAVCS